MRTPFALPQGGPYRNTQSQCIHFTRPFFSDGIKILDKKGYHKSPSIIERVSDWGDKQKGKPTIEKGSRKSFLESQIYPAGRQRDCQADLQSIYLKSKQKMPNSGCNVCGVGCRRRAVQTDQVKHAVAFLGFT